MGNKRHFILLGNGGGGTSCLRGLLNAHSKIECLFEDKPLTDSREFLGGNGETKVWIEKATAAGLKGYTWGNKVPIEQFRSRCWTNGEIIALADHFFIIWLVRRFSKYMKLHSDWTPAQYKKEWLWGQRLYWRQREKHPEKVISVSFEDLLLRPKAELARITNFLGLRFETGMMAGTNDTGFKVYDQAHLNTAKV